MKAAFDTCTGSGKRANIRTTTTEKKNAFEIDNKTWKPEWDSRFSPKDPNVTDKYYALVQAMLSDTTSSIVRSELEKPLRVCD